MARTCPVCSANYHLSHTTGHRNQISIITIPQDNGWTIEAIFPHRASDEDRVKVLTWMMDCRSNIRSVHPLWDVSFYTGKDKYCLIVTPEGREADMKRTARSKANALFEEVVQSYGR